MSSRQTILHRVRANQPAATELPTLSGDWIQFDNVQQEFLNTVEAVGGTASVAANWSEVDSLVREHIHYQAATTVCSLVSGVGRTDIDLASVERPHELSGVDVAIVPGELAVAENGAVWVSAAINRQQALPFICQHLVLVVPAHAIVHNMHEAYERLATSDSTEMARFGVFISGPSKTADIEQSLVIGAQGARSLLVVVVEETAR